jgi:hypothetical protein
MKGLQKRFSLSELDDFSIFNQKSFSTVAYSIGACNIFNFSPDEKESKIKGPVVFRFFLEKVPFLWSYPKPDWRFWGAMEQDILPDAGKVKFYYASGSYEDFDNTKNNDNFYAVLRTRTMDFLERLAKYNAWTDANYHRWSMDDLFNYFKENRRDRGRFICMMENELELIYQRAPNIIKNWTCYNDLLKMK